MYFSLITLMLTVLAAVLMLLYRYLDNYREKRAAPGFTVIPLAEGADAGRTERFVRACIWENAFGGGLKRDIILVSCGCEELDNELLEFSRQYEGIRLVRAEELTELLLDAARSRE